MEGLLPDWIEGAYATGGFAGVMAVVALAILGWMAPALVKKIPSPSKFFGGAPIDLPHCGALTKMKTIMDFGVPSMRVECPLRKHVFSHILSVQMGELRQAMVILVSDKPAMARHRREFKDMLEYVLKATFASVERKFERDGVPKIAYTRFLDIYSPYKDFLIGYAGQICESEIVFDSNEERMLAVLDFMASMFLASLTAVEKVIGMVNGEMSRVEFQGRRCERCSEKCPFIAKEV